MSSPKLLEMEYDKTFTSQVKSLGALASPGSYVELRGKPGALSVCFFGKEVQSRCDFPAPCQAAFSAATLAKDFLELMRSFPEGKLTIRETALTISAGKTRMNRTFVPGIPEPVFPDFPPQGLARIPNSTFESAALAAYAAAQTSEGDSMERVSIQLEAGAVSIVSTNGQIAVWVKSPADYDGEPMEYLLHPRVITALAPLASREDAPEILIGSDSRRYLLRYGDFEITVSIPGQTSRRANIESVLRAVQETPSLNAVLDTAGLILFLERAKLLDGNSSRRAPIFLSADSRAESVQANYETGLGDIEDSLAAQISGSLPKAFIALSLRNLSEVCSHVTLPILNLAFRGPEAPMTVTEYSGPAHIVHLVLPVVVKRQESSCEDDMPFNTDGFEE